MGTVEYLAFIATPFFGYFCCLFEADNTIMVMIVNTMMVIKIMILIVLVSHNYV